MFYEEENEDNLVLKNGEVHTCKVVGQDEHDIKSQFLLQEDDLDVSMIPQ